MSRVGKVPIIIPDQINLAIDNNKITVKGPKGELSLRLNKPISVKQDGNTLTVIRSDDTKVSKSLHGLSRSLIQNMITGVTDGYEKRLEVEGVGYKVSLAGKTLKLSLGLSHDIEFDLPDSVSANVEQNKITITGIDKQQVSQVAAEIRAFKTPEPYKGKGIHYEGEYIIRKAGKAAAGGKE